MKLKKYKPVDKVIVECGFGCKIVINTIDKFNVEDKSFLGEKVLNHHHDIFHGLKVRAVPEKNEK